MFQIGRRRPYRRVNVQIQQGKEFFVLNRNAMNKERTKKQKTKNVLEMPIVNPYSAGIDISDKEHVVAVPEGLSDKRVTAFGAMTSDLEALASWLEGCEIDTVAMESTGVYWKPLFQLLVSRGFEVYLVNAAHIKNLTGRKDDENDAMWIQKLHSCGLLKTSYLPGEQQDELRTLTRYRRTLTEDCSRFINRMQKALELMNIKFHTVINDITGKTGTAVIEAIIGGERDAHNFLPFIDPRIKASPEAIVKSLEGYWRSDHLFTLKESYAMYKIYKEKIAACDSEIEKHLLRWEASCNEGEIAPKGEKAKEGPAKRTKKQKHKGCPQFDTRSYLEKIHGTDVLAIFGLSETSGLELLAEVGTDMGKWKNEKHFVSWLNLCPNNKISGGKLISSRLFDKHPNPGSEAFRHAANGVQNMDNWLGDYFRRMKAKGGHKYAIVATANKLATIYYKMVRFKKEFIPVDLTDYRAKYKQAKISYLERKLAQLKAEAA
jgi:transposase